MDRNETIAARFGRADTYDQHAKVQARIAGKLAARIVTLDLPARPRVLEIGCGTGFLSTDLYQRLPGAIWTITDIAPDMVERTREKLPHEDITYAVMDGENIPQDFPGGFDLICSSMAMQWFADLPKAIANLTSMLTPKGKLAIATMIDGSFAEWRDAQAAEGLQPATPDYPTAVALADMAPRNCGVLVGYEDETEQHENSRTFLTSLKAIGAGTPRGDRAPLSPKEMRRVMRRFDANPVARYSIGYAVYSRA